MQVVAVSPSRVTLHLIAICLALLPGVSCSRGPEAALGTSERMLPATLEGGETLSDEALSAACRIALAPHQGEMRIDQEIVRWQQQARKGDRRSFVLERLGWLYVNKARLSYDSGYYKLAEQTALCLETTHPDAPAALLLRGHVLHSLHRFKEVEVLARKLVGRRGGPFDYGLLGDALMEQGKLEEAIESYQSMVDLRPDVHSYSRISHIRWLKGDLEGAVKAMRMATRAGSPRDPDSLAWAFTRLALYELQGGDTHSALQYCRAALSSQNGHAPALLVRGRILLSRGETLPALEDLSRAADLNPLPEYLWWWAEALQEAGRVGEANTVVDRLRDHAFIEDPRTLSVYLASRDEDVEFALQLARREMDSRSDIFTLDAMAWSLRATGSLLEASRMIHRALAQGTQDARLFLHAGVIALETGDRTQAVHWLRQAREIEQMLLPSERKLLSQAIHTNASGAGSPERS